MIFRKVFLLNRWVFVLGFLCHAPSSYGQIADMNGATPHICHYKIDGVDTESACMSYSTFAMKERTEMILKKMLPYPSEKAFNKFIAGRSVEKVCIFDQSLKAWQQGTVKYEYNGDYKQKFVANAGKIVFKDDRTCGDGVTVKSPEDVDRVGPSTGSRDVALKFFSDNGKKYRYFSPKLFNTKVQDGGKKPVLDTGTGTYMAMGCRLRTGDGKEDHRACSQVTASADHCRVKFFETPSRAFPFQGYWWVQGRKGGGPNVDRSFTVCTGGVTRQLTSEIKATSGDPQILPLGYSTNTSSDDYSSTALANLTKIINGVDGVGGLYNLIGDDTGASPPDPADGTYRFGKITVCRAKNLNRTDGSEVDYICTNKGEDQVVDDLIFESVIRADGDTTHYDVTDNSVYQRADAKARTAQCWIRPLQSNTNIKIDQFMYPSGTRTYTTNFVEASPRSYVLDFYTHAAVGAYTGSCIDNAVDGICVGVGRGAKVCRKLDGTAGGSVAGKQECIAELKKNDATGTYKVGDGYGPFVNSGMQVAIVEAPPRKGRPVKFVSCTQVEYTTMKEVD